MLDQLVDRLWGPWCEAVTPNGEAVCWQRIPASQPARLCDDCWDLLVTRGQLAQRVELAREPDAPDWAIEHFASDPHEMVRSEIVQRSRLPDAARRQLIRRDQAGRVTRKAAKRTDLSVDEQRELTHCTDVATLRILGGSSIVHRTVRDMLARHPDDGVRAAVEGGTVYRP